MPLPRIFLVLNFTYSHDSCCKIARADLSRLAREERHLFPFDIWQRHAPRAREQRRCSFLFFALSHLFFCFISVLFAFTLFCSVLLFIRSFTCLYVYCIFSFVLVSFVFSATIFDFGKIWRRKDNLTRKIIICFRFDSIQKLNKWSQFDKSVLFNVIQFLFALFLLLSCSRKHTHTGKIACVKSQNVIFFFFVLLFRRHKAFIFSVYLLLFSSIQLFSLHLIYFYHFAIWWKKNRNKILLLIA